MTSGRVKFISGSADEAWEKMRDAFDKAWSHF